MDYEWDSAKAAANRRRHGVDFLDAIGALEDPDRLEAIDSRFGYDEERIQTIGMTHGVILFIVTTMREEAACRIISARKATRREQNRYYAGERETW